jgi:hypothetical protein
MIEAKKLTKRYRPVTAVDGLTFTARPGHVTGFLGPNGAGGAARSGNRCRWPAWIPRALRAADWPDCLPPAAPPAHGRRPGSGSGSGPMRHADDEHAGHLHAATRQMKDHCRKDISNNVCHR